jgi:hypothetical protein
VALAPQHTRASSSRTSPPQHTWERLTERGRTVASACCGRCVTNACASTALLAVFGCERAALVCRSRAPSQLRSSLDTFQDTSLQGFFFKSAILITRFHAGFLFKPLQGFFLIPRFPCILKITLQIRVYSRRFDGVCVSMRTRCSVCISGPVPFQNLFLTTDRSIQDVLDQISDNL